MVVYRLDTRVIELKHVFKSREIVISPLLYPLRVFPSVLLRSITRRFPPHLSCPRRSNSRGRVIFLFYHPVVLYIVSFLRDVSTRIRPIFIAPHTPKGFRRAILHSATFASTLFHLFFFRLPKNHIINIPNGSFYSRVSSVSSTTILHPQNVL